MTTPWTEDQVAALAPDASSLSAARKLVGRWRESGQHGDALWGRCQGSGATPYQTIVDLSGPAYRCSCPSRKFPCKHALSLLLCWAAGEVPAVAQVADYAASWIGGRAARSTSAGRSRTPNPATAEQRGVRVTAGLEELDVWLGDQVRTGLAQSDRSFRAFEGIAARMVDAQAPGLASALRQLPAITATRTDWPDVVLREYARMHLLVAAHRQLDAAPPALRASIRTHIGYPNPAEAVRTEPPVRDRWMVFGLRITEEERLYTRRTWLYGRATRRWALIVDHSFGSPSFPADLPALGQLADAEVHFYPGAAPLRALWGERHGPAEFFTTLPAADRPATIAAALADHAAALGADPWLRSWPMLLVDVVPARTDQRWYVTESDGTALPIRATEDPWTLLAVSGGHPVTVLGEWNADGLAPISVFATAEVIDLARADLLGHDVPRSPAGQSTSADLTSAALLGTARRTPDRAALAPSIARAVERLSADPAFRLLESAALQDLFTRGGVAPATATAPEPAADDARRLLPRPAAARLARMLRERSAFLPEWFDAAAPQDYRAPDALCEQLLEHAKINASLREPLLRLAGARGSWLAAQHPEWRALVRQPTASADIWQFGQPPERRDWLARLRRDDPDAARAQLAAAWPKESGPIKTELLAVLADGLDPADEPLLETALDDRRADVRRTAAGLLALLPESAFAQRMRARASAWVRVEHRLLHTNLVIALADTLDAATQRDGITDRTVEFAYRWNGTPDVPAAWLRQMVAATPLPHWTDLLGSPEQAVRATIEDRFRQPVFDGWVDAALAQRDSAWARALFEAGVPTDLAMLRRRELFALLPLPDRTAHLGRLDGSWLSEIEALLPAMGHPWPEALAQHVVLLLFERARAAARRPDAHGVSPNAHRSLLASAAVHLPVPAAATLSSVARRCDDPAWERAFDQLAHDLNHRSMMLEELQ
ncbi:SWIM zinc finger family protein [Nocardia sp. NBC_00508]|uniref:SWIM zinc finger family protein n=1 Tax=Nocardia sp. NBC_00508 TaxID=2975992 RepID=UPI002E819FF0|nr:SWIM zinc finger family protein [Nocardia sp. NBC_00508]WUD64391.1 SWIM zinc finger family protein [Nocardia sp. NBC_00508]